MKMIATGFRSVVWPLVVFAIMTFPASSQVIYRLDLQNGAGPEWSDGRVFQTPTGRNFLGEFGAETNFLTLNGLPAHTNLVISFDLAILRTWDGNGGSPDDTWELRLLSTDG